VVEEDARAASRTAKRPVGRIAQSQAEASDKFLASTNNLVASTHRLGTATW